MASHRDTPAERLRDAVNDFLLESAESPRIRTTMYAVHWGMRITGVPLRIFLLGILAVAQPVADAHAGSKRSSPEPNPEVLLFRHYVEEIHAADSLTFHVVGRYRYTGCRPGIEIEHEVDCLEIFATKPIVPSDRADSLAAWLEGSAEVPARTRLLGAIPRMLFVIVAHGRGGQLRLWVYNNGYIVFHGPESLTVFAVDPKERLWRWAMELFPEWDRLQELLREAHVNYKPDTPPVLLREPTRPAALDLDPKRGADTLTVSVEIRADGRVHKMLAISNGDLLTPQVAAMLRTSEYRPAAWKGRPVRTHLEVSVPLPKSGP